MKRVIYALRFLTVLPIPWREGEPLEDVARSISLFPLVGLFIAAGVWMAGFVCSIAFGIVVTRVVAVVAWIGITGGLHLDGLADTADGLFGGRSPTRRLEIMRDSRIGTFGVLAVTSTVLLKVALLVEMPPESLAPAILIAAVVARLCQVLLIAVYPSAREEGLGAFFKAHVVRRDIAAAAVLAVILAGLAGGPAGLGVLGGAVAVALGAGLWISRRLSGLTGDTYGAVSEIIETLALAACYVVQSPVSGIPVW